MHPYSTRYNQVALPKLKEHTTYASTYEVPIIKKVSINCGLGDVLTNGKAVDEVTALIAAITGQKAVQTKAHKAIAGFKIRQGMVVGLKTTLRAERMNDFLMKLTDIALPRTRDFRGLPATGITASGTLNIGIKDSSIFPEVSYGSIPHGLQITIVSNAKSVEEARLLYETMGFLFQAEGEETKKKKNSKKSHHKRT